MGILSLLTTKWNFGVNNLSGEESRLKMALTLGVLWKRLLKKCAKIGKFDLADRRMKVSRLAEETGISAGAGWTIIHEKLDMSKVSARWVPRMLSPFQKDTRRQCCQAAHWGSGTFFSTFGDRRRDLGISQRFWVQNGVHAVEAQDFPHP